jgi:integrase/recombinase XerD
LDLRQWSRSCAEERLELFGVSRAHIELYARGLEETGKARATISQRLSTIVGFYRNAEEERLIDVSPAVHVRRPQLDYESRALGLDRNEVGALLVTAGLAGGRVHALVSLPALKGLRISEARGADIEHLAVERGHRTLRIVRKGAKTATIPLAPRTARAIELVVGERLEGPLFLAVTGDRLDRHAAARIVRRLARRAGITTRIGPQRHAFITAALDADPVLLISTRSARRSGTASWRSTSKARPGAPGRRRRACAVPAARSSTCHPWPASSRPDRRFPTGCRRRR